MNSSEIQWKLVLTNPLEIKTAYKVLPTKGKIAWEYNPFRNYRLSKDMLEYKGKLYTESEMQKLIPDYIKTVEDNGTVKEQYIEGITKYQKGELVDFVTNELKFSLNNPVNILPYYSYDGSVDLILNDGLNEPRLINSRFSTTGLNTYEVINRKGNNDTNIYDLGDLFDIDTSLYKKTEKIPLVQFEGTFSGGDLKVGNYHFYFKYADADGNETDFIAESGLVSIFKGSSRPAAISTGQRDENSLKRVVFKLSNIDAGYQYLHVYYTRSSAEINLNMYTEAKKINLNYLVSLTGECSIVITGDEELEEVSIKDINLQFNVIQAAKSQCTAQNMLFLANVLKAEIPYEELQDLSLRFLPYLKKKEYPLQMDENYNITSTSKGYYDSKFIYDFTGYWGDDLYRLGIVYIMKDNTLSPVFNIRGRVGVKSFGVGNRYSYDYCDSQYSLFKTYDEDGNRKYINYNEATNYIIPEESSNEVTYENVKGVVSLAPDEDTNKIFGFLIVCDPDAIDELRKYTKGFFFVRQKRMPLTLCQGITIGIENNSNLPAIPTQDGVTNISYENTYEETEDRSSDSTHFVMEGFMSRFTYKLKTTSGGFWSKIGKIAAIAAIASAVVATCIITAGTSAITIGAVLAATKAAAGTLAIVGMAAGGVTGAGLIYAGVSEAVHSIRISKNRSKAKDPYYGRNQKIPKGFTHEEIEDSRLLDGDFGSRVILVDPEKCRIGGLIVPEYTVNPAKFNSLFTGEEFYIQNTMSLSILNKYIDDGYFKNDGKRHFYIPGYIDLNETYKSYVRLTSVADSCPAVGIKNYIFRARGGDESLVLKFSLAIKTYKDKTLNTNSDLIRGNFGPYVAMEGYNGSATTLVSIKIPGYKEGMISEYIKMRMNDHSEFCAISDRIDLNNIKERTDNLGQNLGKEAYKLDCYRGDCYICQFTQRINRNFNDNTAPYNESIVDPKTWKNNYDVEDLTKLKDINLGDVNAVELGMWVTFRIRSNYNLNIRTVDDSWAEEAAESGHNREYFPKAPMSTDGSYKLPEAQVYNLGFSKSLSERYNFEVPDVPYIRNWYGTRIMYSDINITDGYKNGFRTFKGTAYRDYTREYGEITKIVELNSNILIIFEHAVGLIEVNERAVAAQSASGFAYITTNNVLPEKPHIICDTYGSQWADSVIKVPLQMGSPQSIVYGIDTVAKKIWRCDGQRFECISDKRVQEFLNNNITLGERELKPTLGIRNVKSFYNAFKGDVMFTFYDNIDTLLEKVWNLCYSPELSQFTTFYSWVPSFLENIDNIPFSFDRNISKWIALLGISHTENSFADGIVISNNILSEDILTKSELSIDNPRLIGELSITNRILPENITYKIEFEKVRDSRGVYHYFDVKPLVDSDGNDLLDANGHVRYGVFFAQNPEKDTNTYEDSDNDLIIGNDDSKIYVSETAETGYIPTEGNTSCIKVLTKDLDTEYFGAADFYSELYYRNKEGHEYSDWDDCSNKDSWPVQGDMDYEDYKNKLKTIVINSKELNLPAFKDRSGKRKNLPSEEQLNSDKIISLLNIRANIKFKNEADDINSAKFEAYKNSTNLTGAEQSDVNWVDCGYYESQIALVSDWNLQFLISDFWKHGLAGLIDIADDIKPTTWYGETHPFEFEFIVVNDPSVHKIFLNLELVSNKAKPESFHFEVIGESYDFAKDKANMYFRQEARKALFLYNGADITYDRNFLKISPKLQPKSAELVASYYERVDKLDKVYDDYEGEAKPSRTYEKRNAYLYYSPEYDSWANLTPNSDYRHLSGAEIVYYKNRNEYRIWQHLPAIDIDSLPLDHASSVIRANCKYLEDRWKISINPLLICYKNEYTRANSGPLCLPNNSTWPLDYSGNTRIPPITLRNSSIPDRIKTRGAVDFPNPITLEGKDNALYKLYQTNAISGLTTSKAIDMSDWLKDVSIYKYNFGEAQNRKETDIRDKFVKVRIRYSGEDLAIIDFVNTIYTVSYA